MFNPEVRPQLSHRIDAYAHFMDAIAQLEEELETESNMQAAERLEESLEQHNQAFDVLAHENNIPFVASFLRAQVTELSTQVNDQEDYKNIQRLSCLAADLSRAA